MDKWEYVRAMDGRLPMNDRDENLKGCQTQEASPRIYTLGMLRVLEDQFSYHPPKDDQLPRYSALRIHGHALAVAILNHCPPGADRDEAIRLVRNAVMTANAAIAIGESNDGRGAGR